MLRLQAVLSASAACERKGVSRAGIATGEGPHPRTRMQTDTEWNLVSFFASRWLDGSIVVVMIVFRLVLFVVESLHS
jgi:hypothetical protein